MSLDTHILYYNIHLYYQSFICTCGEIFLQSMYKGILYHHVADTCIVKHLCSIIMRLNFSFMSAILVCHLVLK